MNRMEQYIPKSFSGAISVIWEGKSVFRKVCGYADRPNRIKNSIDTKFPTASAGKAFVATGIMRLIDEKRLSLGTRIGSLLDFDLHSIDPDITIRQLLSHTSGIPDYFDETVMGEYSELFGDYPNYKIRSSKDLLPLFIGKSMMYPAGEKFQYNNSGYVVLGLVIEQITGIPFDAYLKESVFMPLGMNATGYYELDRLPARCANAYIWDDKAKEYYTNIYSVDAKGTGAGGAFTTLPDIERFWRGLTKGLVISPETFALMTSPQAGNGKYGYGFWLTDEGTPYFQGSDPGVSFISAFYPAQQAMITIVSNLGQDVWRIHAEMRKALFTFAPYRCRKGDPSCFSFEEQPRKT